MGMLHVRRSLWFQKGVVCVLFCFCNLLITSCGSDTGVSSAEQTAVHLDESLESVLAEFGNTTETVDDLVQHPGKQRWYASPGDRGDMVTYAFGFQTNAENETRPAFEKSNGERLFVDFSLLRGIYLADANGSPVQIAGKSVAYKPSATKMAQIDPAQWVSNGIAVIGGGVALWLGLSSVRFIAAGLGTIAVAGIVIGGAVFAIGFFSDILEQLGWDTESFRQLFGGTLNDLQAIIVGVVEQFQTTYTSS